MRLPVQIRLSALACCLSLLSVAAIAADRYELPAPEEERNLPGEGQLRRYPGYVKGWPTRRSAWAQRVQRDQGAVVFLGDSITQGWGDDFKGHFSGMKLANRGISGDTTRGMLIRLEEDVLSLNPKAIVLLMGTNDIEVDIDPQAVGRNFKKIIAGIRAHKATLPIVLCRMFPSSASKNRPSETINAINALYEETVKGDPYATVVDTWALFADKEGDANPRWFRDLLHLNDEGYDKWASALHPIFATLGFLDTEADAFTPEKGYRSLFNGRDLTGWGVRATPPPPPWAKQRKVLFSEHKENVSFDGKVRSDDGRYYAINDRLVVTTPPELRRIQQLWTTEEFPYDFILKLEFRAAPNADSGVFLRGKQFQVRDYVLAGPYNDLESYRPQEWNEMVFEVKNGKATVSCNGLEITDSFEVPETGPIGLEGDRGQIEYRRIRIKRLAD